MNENKEDLEIFAEGIGEEEREFIEDIVDLIGSMFNNKRGAKDFNDMIQQFAKAAKDLDIKVEGDEAKYVVSNQLEFSHKSLDFVFNIVKIPGAFEGKRDLISISYELVNEPMIQISRLYPYSEDMTEECNDYLRTFFKELLLYSYDVDIETMLNIYEYMNDNEENSESEE